MKSNNKLTIILLFGALLTGGAGWFLTQNYIDTQVTDYKSDFDDRRQAVSVVVASRNLAVGDVLSPATAQIRQIPGAYVPRDAIRPGQFGAVEGRQLIHAIKLGEPILKIHVNAVKVDGLASLLEDGERAITIPVDTLDTMSGFLNPGDRVDLYITLKDGERDRTVPLVENVRVLATGKDIDDGISEGQKKYNEITIGVTPLDATRVIHGQIVGDLAVLLRKSQDEGSRFDDYVTIDNLIDNPQDAAPTPQRATGWGFELIKGGTRS
ncbi:Flp pilus assembly protein CpaB [Gammaproteobacteria bacterium 45_16_T64]|nr:Flp pilus assembly protein CpaB [Gammaproteobacteria bacterium 45_16_T64]